MHALLIHVCGVSAFGAYASVFITLLSWRDHLWCWLTSAVVDIERSGRLLVGNSMMSLSEGLDYQHYTDGMGFGRGVRIKERGIKRVRERDRERGRGRERDTERNKREIEKEREKVRTKTKREKIHLRERQREKVRET